MWMIVVEVVGLIVNDIMEDIHLLLKLLQKMMLDTAVVLIM